MTEQIDMSRFIEAKSDQLNADDLIGAPRTITITRVTGNDGDQPVSLFYEGDNGKPFKPCKTIRRVLMGVWGRYANEYVGRSMTIYRDDKVTFGGLETGGIRISHMSHIDKETVVVVMKSKGKKAGIKIMPLQGQAKQQPAADPRARAEKWLSDYEAALLAAKSLDDVDLIHRKADNAVAKLAREFPDLHARAQALRPMTGADTATAENPTAAEGRGDGDRGEPLFGESGE